jgi:hypothetical protein
VLYSFLPSPDPREPGARPRSGQSVALFADGSFQISHAFL